eukprot:m.22396 g.22396  ORF g.22396 m.22396 type:complete len:503 (-) comp7396_c0_seq1:30-1538(-)
MFSDQAPPPTHIPSTWQKKTSVSNAVSCQTSQVLTDNGSSQTNEPSHAWTQTEEEIEELIVADDDGPEILDFLLRIEEDVCAQLRRNATSHAFNGYEVCWEDEVKDVNIKHKLSHDQLECSAVCWNSSGSLVIVGYGRNNTEAFCEEKGFVCTWNIDRSTLNENRPDKVIETASYVTSMAAHPKVPSLLAVGTFNGQLCLIDMAQQNGQETVAVSVSDGYSHTEPINSVSWVARRNMREKDVFFLFTIGGDGKILIWHTETKKRKPGLELAIRFIVHTSDLPRYALGGTPGMHVELGLTCASFSHEDENTFIVGSETGGVFRCSLNKVPMLSGDQRVPPNELAEMNPVAFGYQPHKGPVYGVSCSPYHRNLFLTASTDGCVRLNSLIEVAPLYIFETEMGYLFDVCWSTSRPMVFYTSTSQGKIIIYDLHQSKTRSTMILEEEASNGSPIYSLALNSRGYLLSGNGMGGTYVWRLNSQLQNPDVDELPALHAMAALDDVNSV